MSLYTKYRPRDWDSVVSQDYITTILRNSLKSGRVSHAYLFHGSRGTGKTTSARILAKALNCTNLQNGNPCHACDNCQAFDNETMLDIIEIDGASNNGVENVRDLIEKARFEPNQGVYKIYIIDEVHMLSTGAFNALLKILEEPPSHVKFILATTEIDKVPETIRSRTLRFDFKKITLENIISRLHFVVESEGLKAEEAALEIIAKSARGGLRDALTLLEQNIIDNEVSTEHVRYTLSLIEDTLIENIIVALVQEDSKGISTILENLKERHLHVRAFFDQIMYRLRDLMIEHLDDSLFYTYDEVLELFEESYGRIRIFPDGMMLVEVTLFRIAKRGGKPSYPQESASKTQSNSSVPKSLSSPEKNTKPITPPTKEVESTTPLPIEKEEVVSESHLGETLEPIKESESNIGFSYPKLITELKETNPALTTDLKTARFTQEQNKLTLHFSKKWNFDRVNTVKIKYIISETCGSLFTGEWIILCELKEGSQNQNMSEGVF